MIVVIQERRGGEFDPGDDLELTVRGSATRSTSPAVLVLHPAGPGEYSPPGHVG